MLRFDFMPSDFNPMFLFLGNERDLADLAALLRRFGAAPEALSVREAIAGSIGKATLRIVPGEGESAPYGLRETGDDRFEWVLNGWQAEQIAERIDKLVPAELKSGNDIFELGVEGEIPVKVSRGEFTEEFLTKDHYLHPDYVGPA